MNVSPLSASADTQVIADSSRPSQPCLGGGGGRSGLLRELAT
jgi:hypothetical protein